MESNPKDLINYERTWRTVMCLNPEHQDSVKFDTNEIGTIKCPMCESVMVVEVKPKFIVFED